MTTFDNLNAPQYSTFDNTDEEDAEKYFSVMEETIASVNSSDDNTFSSTSRTSSPNGENVLHLRNRKIRRSISLNDLNNLENDFQHMTVSDNNTESEQSRESVAPSAIYNNLLDSRQFCSQDTLNRLAVPKRYPSNRSVNKIDSNQFISMAEAVKKFHEKTPNRFHSRTKAFKSDKSLGDHIKLKVTIPNSPMLLTKKRIKQNLMMAPSYDERILKEFEEEQKFKVKAHPLNKKILQEPHKITIDKKPVTQPEPFKLTEATPKKPPTSVPDKFQFHARPIPKAIYNPPKLAEVISTRVPAAAKKQLKPSPIRKVQTERPRTPPKNTVPVPFSFEKRDMNLFKKRELLIQKTLEEEKRAREFHARPIPKPVVAIMEKKELVTQVKKEDQLETTFQPFKAKPPVILNKKPFQPKPLSLPLTRIEPFQLQSEIRAKQRENFEMKKKEEERKIAELLLAEQREREKREQEEVKRLRKELDFKAQPVKQYKTLKIKPSGLVTVPQSPLFKSGNKENINKN